MGENKYKVFLECAAFFGIACIAVSLIFAVCFQGTNLYTAFRAVGEVIAYAISIILAFFWVKRQHHVAWTVAYVIFVVLIVVLDIVGLVGEF